MLDLLFKSNQKRLGLEGELIRCVKNPNYEMFLDQVYKDYPDAKFIYMVRNPSQSILAQTTKMLYKTGQIDEIKQAGAMAPIKFEPIKKWKKSVSSLMRQRANLLAHNMIVVKLEDLQFDREQTMRKVADFIGISFNESLLKTTLDGKKWYGNSTSNSKWNKSGDVYHLSYSEAGIGIVEGLLSREMRAMGYDVKNAKPVYAHLASWLYEARVCLSRLRGRK